MIYVELFWNFLMIGALSFGGGYGMISLVRETVLGHGWLTEGEFLSFIAVSESTPGPLAINMATFIGASQGGFWGALCATLGVVLPSFVIILLVAAVLAGVLIGKEVFGGYGSYPFNPAAVGYVVAAVSWPEQVFRYPQPYTSIPLWDASMVPVSSAIEDTLRSGGMLNIGSLALGLGEYAAPMGTGAALVILACGLFLWTQKDAHMSASISFLVTCAVIAFFFPRQAGLADSAVLSNILPRLQCVRDELLTGAILFSAVFLINEPYTCVHHRMGRVLYGVLVGVVSMGFRYYGVYETGVCFALLAVNSVSAWIDRTEAKLYHLTHLQADAGKGAAQ